MNKKYVKLLALLLVATMMTTALLGCKAKEEPVTTEPTVAATDAPTAVEPEAEPEITEAEQEETETEPEATEEDIIETEPEVDAPEPGSITYEEYLALEVEVQQAYYEKFETPDDFFAWMNAAKAEQETATEPQPTVGSENVENEEPTTPAGDIFIDDENVEDWE